MPLDASLFVSDTLHQRTVKLADGAEHTLHFRELKAATFRAFQIEEQSEDTGVRGGSMARLIAGSLCEPDGKPALTYDQAQMLKPEVMTKMVAEIIKLNQLQAEHAKGLEKNS